MTTIDVTGPAPMTTAIPVADLCHVCHRGLVRPSDGAAWTVACALCRRIDRRLAEDHGPTQCTPL